MGKSVSIGEAWRQKLNRLAENIFEIVCGCGLFILVGCMAVLIQEFADWMATKNVAPFVISMFRAVEIVVFLGDTVYFLSFFIKRVVFGIVNEWRGQ
jgi:hypothetical protein